ncbi:MAG: hypothetical protein SGPRY_013639, partial [Prymnesium sp.]
MAMLLLAGSSWGFRSVHRPPSHTHKGRALPHPLLSASGGTETVDFTLGAIRPQRDVTDDQMRPRPSIDWSNLRARLEVEFGIGEEKLKAYDAIEDEAFLKAFEMMQLCRQFENACNQAYMQGNIRGFMHLDNGQETIPAFVADTIKQGDIKYSYYREHTHALASGVEPGAVMAELFAKDTGTCRGAGGSMHIFDKDTNFQGGWALVSEQLPYAVGAARSILLDRHLGIAPEDDDRIAIVFIGEGGAQNGRISECLNAAAKEKLPILFIVDGSNLEDTMRTGRAVTDYVRESGPAILQVHTYRFQGHSPADPEHERGRKQEKMWARAECDPIKIFEATEKGESLDLTSAVARAKELVKSALEFAKKSDPPPEDKLEFPDPADTDYNSAAILSRAVNGEEILAKTVDAERIAMINEHVEKLQKEGSELGTLSIGDALNLAILEEMLRDPKTTIHAEDLQAGSSYNIPKLTQQTFGTLRAADEIIDEGHFIGKALGEGMNGYRPIVELMNTNFGIYGIAEMSSAGNTRIGKLEVLDLFANSLPSFPLLSPRPQALGAEHSQPLHAYVMGIPGLKICTAASPEAAYGLAKAMIRDNGPGILFTPVKTMKEAKGFVDVG